jgi:cyanophycinase
MGFILLEGGNEFNGMHAQADLRALAIARGKSDRVAIIPAAAAPDRNHANAGRRAVAWFEGLGAQAVSALPVIDPASAGDPVSAAALASARLVFLLGGFPQHLADTLRGSRAWQAVLEAWRQGAVIAGSSAGAMVLGGVFFDPVSEALCPGLGLLPDVCVIPHHDTFGRRWAPKLAELAPEAVKLGIDEETGMINEGPGGRWAVYGRGAVNVYTRGGCTVHAAGSRMELPIPPVREQPR